MADADVTRRDVLTTVVYMTPAIVTLPVVLSFASAGSGDPKGKDTDKDKKPKYSQAQRPPTRSSAGRASWGALGQ